MNEQKRSVTAILEDIKKCNSVHELMRLYSESRHAIGDDPDAWIKVLEMLIARNLEMLVEQSKKIKNQ